MFGTAFKKYGWLFVVLGIFLLGGYFLIWPKYQATTTDFDQEEGRLLAARAQASSNVKKLSALEQKLASVSDQQELLDSLLWEDPEPGDIYLTLETWAAESGYRLSNLTLTGLEGNLEADTGIGQAIRPLDVSLTMERLDDLSSIADPVEKLQVSYDTFLGLLGRIESTLPLFQLQSVDFSGNISSSVNLDLRTYYYVARQEK